MPAYDALTDLERLWLLSIAHTDLKQAIDAVQLMRAPLTEAGTECVQDALIVRYSRCFLGCELPNGKGSTRLPAHFATVEGSHPDLHAAIIENRNKIVAHSDMTRKDVILEKIDGDRFRSFTSGARFDVGQIGAIGHLVIGVLENIKAEAVPLARAILGAHKAGDRVELRSLLQMQST